VLTYLLNISRSSVPTGWVNSRIVPWVRPRSFGLYTSKFSVHINPITCHKTQNVASLNKLKDVFITAPKLIMEFQSVELLRIDLGPNFPLTMSRTTGIQKKVNVKLSLCLTKHHAMKTFCGNGGIAPRILDLGTRWR
jgi:hypothetical protein